MSKLTFTGPFGMRLRSLAALNRIGMQVGLCHLLGQRMAPDWDWIMETGLRFWRGQFTHAMRMGDIARGRRLFDSLLTETDDRYAVQIEESDDPKGLWIMPNRITTDLTMLYLHGGGYTFAGRVSTRFGAMLAHHTGARLFMPRYRLTPEHPHPAQAEDALTAWQHLRAARPADRIIVAGDSAGGHMALMLLQTLKEKALAQPGLCIAICPWTDIGPRGDSLTHNDRYDMVQGWMALRFGEWLDPGGRYGRATLSPISYEFAGLAPIYMLAGGREVLRDMIIDFAEAQADRQADVMLDLWPDMPHDFLAYDSMKASSAEALARIRQLVDTVGRGGPSLLPNARTTRICAGRFAADSTGFQREDKTCS